METPRALSAFAAMGRRSVEALSPQRDRLYNYRRARVVSDVVSVEDHLRTEGSLRSLRSLRGGGGPHSGPLYKGIL